MGCALRFTANKPRGENPPLRKDVEMSNIVPGMIAGFVATLVLSVLMVLKSMMGVMPGLDVIMMLGQMMGSPSSMGWIAHFVIGTVVWGIGFAVLYEMIPGGNAVMKGIVFGIGAWLIMMIAVMPMAGAGIFGMNMGMMAPVMTLVLHIIFGAVLGAVFKSRAAGSAAA